MFLQHNVISDVQKSTFVICDDIQNCRFFLHPPLITTILETNLPNGKIQKMLFHPE